MNHKSKKLRRLLETISPEHDTPVGLVHPYWARKPLNIVEEVIKNYSPKDGVVIDPFMGSGTTLFAALKNNRISFGGDINPLSVFIVRAILEIAAHGDMLLPEIERILDIHASQTKEWFLYLENEYIERARFTVQGEFAMGNFVLKPTELVTKQFINGRWTKRRAYDIETLSEVQREFVHDNMKLFLASPVDFEAIELIPNSRIAIPVGANLSHYFTPQNRASINLLISLIRESPLYGRFPDAMMLIVSSSLPLLRLSDKKASSQWPYWRPKQNLTSRNPIMVLRERMKAIQSLNEWSKANLSYVKKEAESLHLQERMTVLQCSAQRFNDKLKPNSLRADLVFTDPPYGDQVPYIEYSSLWTGILGFEVSGDTYSEEVVKTDAMSRKNDTNDYHNRLRTTLLSNTELLKDGGNLVWYYQDQDLSCWATIHSAAKDAGLILIDIIPLPKQRRSLKTVTSPNTTIDGDMLCIFQRSNTEIKVTSKKTVTLLKHLKKELKQSDGTYFGKYSILISYSLKYDLIDFMAQEYKTVKAALKALEQ